jgi:hypothetical protein
MYLALGGPGVGKTSGRVVECIQGLCRQDDKRALLVSSLCKVRNSHVAHLRSALDASAFNEQVRVLGSHGLDDLARSRTLPALVWQRMQAQVTAYEDRLTRLDDAASHVVALRYCFVRLSKQQHLVDMIESYGCFNELLASMHCVVAGSVARLRRRYSLSRKASSIPHVCSCRLLGRCFVKVL